ncbi:FAD:protein FMN transferase [Halochromatium sp.]
MATARWVDVQLFDYHTGFRAIGSIAPPWLRIPQETSVICMIIKPDQGSRPVSACLHCRRPALLVLLCLTMILALVGCGRGSEQRVLVLRGATMGTTYSVQIVEPPAGLDRDALAMRIETRLAEINALMSTYQPSSELSRFNASSGTDWRPVSSELVQVVAAAQALSEASAGAFDVTVGPLVNLWGFGPTVTADALPSVLEIEQARARVGWQQLAVRHQPPGLRKAQPNLYVDLSAIAKGYAVDQIAELVESVGVDRYLVEIGGELRGRGLNGRGEPWQIAIERPETSKRAMFRVIALQDLGMATSGDYRNFVEIDGQRYSHTIDPATGRPVGHRLASVTVLADACMQADAWATALLVLGPERGFELAERLGLAAFFIEHAQGVADDERFATQATAAFETLSAQPR